MVWSHIERREGHPLGGLEIAPHLINFDFNDAGGIQFNDDDDDAETARQSLLTLLEHKGEKFLASHR